MNVLFVIHYPVFGGPHNQAALLSRSLARQGVSMTVLLPDQPGNAADRLREAGVDVVVMPLHRLRASLRPLPHMRLVGTLPREVRAIRGIIRSRKSDIVQVGGLVNPHAALAARLEDVPVVWQILDTRLPMAARRMIMPFVLRLSHVVMTTGRAVAEEHPGASRLGERLRPFFPPVDPDFFDPGHVDRGAARGQFGLARDDRVLGTVGNLNPQKGHEYLVQAAAIARRSNRDVRVLIVGASHATHRRYERNLYRLARQLGLKLGEDIIFAGGLADVRPALAAMDLFVLASVPRSEGAPTAVEEAMMMELPIVATDVGSVRELVIDGQTGSLVPPLDPPALAAAALRILQDSRERNALGMHARRRALSLCSAETCARVHLDAYEHAIATHSRVHNPDALPDAERV